ncbi:MAG: hypothetical protein IIV74_00780, partial [Alphaproteobacteria bacterium]|nr:hypothetical protein [Alphaproteobacteria bacterium]
MKKIALTLLSLFLITPCLANIHINPSTVESVVKEFVPADKVVSVISEYNNQLKASNGAGISAQKLWNICAIAGWDIKKPNGKSQCQKFVNALVKKSSIKFYHACAKGNKGKTGYICVDDFFTNKFYGGTQVNLTPGQTLAKEYARLKHNDSTVQCRNKFDPGTLDDTLMCTSHNKNAYYEFVFDDLEEPKDKTIQDSVQNAICRMYDAKPTTAGCAGGGTNVSGTATCWSASCAADSAKCAKINQSMAKFGYSAIYKDNKCEINFNSINNKSKLKTAYGIDNFVFCHGIQVANAPNVETYLKQYVAERAGVSASSVKCDSGFNTYTGTGCTRNGITDFKDDIKTCRVGNNQIDFVFDDINEKWKKTVKGGVQGMSCIVTGGTYSGKRCIGLGEQQCNTLRQSNLKECPECKAAKWDKETQSCLLPSSKSAQNLQKGVNIGLIVGGAVVGVALTVVTAGAAGAPVTAIVLTGIETVGAGIELTSQLKINGIADDFLVESNKCKNATCAKKMLSQNLQRMANYANDMTAAEADAVDSEMARLANLIPDDDEIWATMLANGTDMADNKLGFFDTDSWEPEQVWRAVGIGLQLASVITGITKWAISKSSRIAKSTTAIKQKFTRAIQSIDNAPENTLTTAQMAVKRQLPNKTKAIANANKLDIIDPSKLTGDDIIYYDLWKKYAPRNQPFDDFKAMGTLDEIQEMSKSWIPWEDIEYRNQLIKRRVEFLQANKEAMNLFQSTRSFDAVAKQYPYFANILRQERELYAKGVPELSSGFAGNYSTFNPELRNFVRQRQDLTSMQDKIETTEEIYKRFLNQSVVDEVASLRAEQIDYLINSNPTYKRYKDRFDYLTPEEKQKFATDLIRDIEELNGVDVQLYTKVLQDDNLPEGVDAFYRKTHDENWQLLKSETHMDFRKKQTFESFIQDLSHEVGGHAIDYENPNAGALGAQLQNTIASRSTVQSDVDYDAYTKNATEQSAYRIGAATAKTQHVNRLIVQEFDPYKGFFDSMLERGGSDTFLIYTELVDDGGKIMTPSPDMVTNITNVLDGKAMYQVHGDDTYQI